MARLTAILIILVSRAGSRSPAPAATEFSINCTQLVTPLDSPPIRSPQEVHSLIASLARGKELVEIGTRNGDGMDCFARTASRATALEIEPPYCRKLEQRARILRESRLGAFEVSCRPYQQQCPDADIYTWWEQLPHLSNQGGTNVASTSLFLTSIELSLLLSDPMVQQPWPISGACMKQDEYVRRQKPSSYLTPHGGTTWRRWQRSKIMLESRCGEYGSMSRLSANGSMYRSFHRTRDFVTGLWARLCLRASRWQATHRSNGIRQTRSRFSTRRRYRVCCGRHMFVGPGSE